ncbi:TetR family transcriptional regulator [Acrocarpospora pleiomorpha]|uniref:TetR family transcriptional regulator n=1 Tax=Acrocarpospora pleiomorpha TaxID=90975 RepID=A0A5M3XN87_9ACTN|nr:TetR/AcrR family transcriptional regulator [Acrocarpospora pleiomorpha]GES20613.1 TetR family transcriptional regulator [Acrocarpospora pleiomorpha]
MEVVIVMAQGLRERKKAATRQAVHDAAMRLTIERGIDNVTIDEITEAAGISRRSFSNYFTGKEDALLYADGQQMRALLAAIHERPSGESAWAAMRAVVATMADRDEHTVSEWAIRTRLALTHPGLLAVQLGNHAALERDLAAVVAERDGAGPIRAHVLATAFLASVRIAMRLWVQDGQPGRPGEVIERVLDEMERAFDGH